MRNVRYIVLAIAAVISMAACSRPRPDPHTAQDYAGATSAHDPDGTFTTILGPATPIVVMTSALRFPQGDTAPRVRSVLMYDRPVEGQGAPGMCVFEIGYRASTSDAIVKEAPVQQPCDGKKQARFRIAGVDVAFVGHLEAKDYKGTPVTLFEITDQTKPDSLHLVY